MTGAEFKAARIRAGLTYRACAETLGVSLSTVQRYETLDAIPEATAALMSAIASEKDVRGAVIYTLGELAAIVEAATGKPLPASLTQTAPARPGIAIGQLINLLRRSKSRYLYEDQVTDLMAHLPAELPGGPMPMALQGNYWLGYYHHQAMEHDLRAGAQRRSKGGNDGRP